MADYDHHGDVKRYAADADDAHIDKIVKHLGIALRGADSSLVSCSDESELHRIRDGFAKKKLGLEPDEAMEHIKAVCEDMKGDNHKRRVTFLYHLAARTGKLDSL
ncbi:MAG: DUF2853 family protein [Litorimonas sp.]